MTVVNEKLLPSADEVEFFQREGYWLGPRVVEDERIEKLRRAMDRVYACEYQTGKPPWSSSWKPGDDPSALRKTDNSHWSDLTLRELALDATIGAMCARLLQVDEIRLWHDQLLYKPGGGKTSGNVGWHQDYYYWQCSDRPEMVTAWVALDDVTVENGCMHVVPRSHRWGMMKESDFFNTDIGNLEERVDIPEGDRFETVPCILPKGHVSFHHALTIHGSGPNSTEAPRRSLVIHTMSGNCRLRYPSSADGHMNSLLLRLQCDGKPGGPWDGPYFPRLHPKAG